MYYDFSNVELCFKQIDSRFKAFFTIEEIEEMVKHLNRSVLYNGQCVRLEELIFSNYGVEFIISVTSFYDLLTTNLLINNSISFSKPRLNERLVDFRDLPQVHPLANSYLANAMAVSVMIFDKDKRCIISQRSSNVAISPNKYGVSVTGALDHLDLQANHPIKNCVKREVKEEVNIDIKEADVDIKGLFIDDVKYQPTLICNVQLEEAFDPVNILMASDLEAENIYFQLISQSDLPHYQVLEMTQAAKFHIETVIRE